MELIIVLTKAVVDKAEADAFAVQVRTFIANSPALSDPSVHVDMETREQIESG